MHRMPGGVLIRICRYCRTPAVVPGPRNEKRVGVCGRDVCRLAGLLDLAAADMLNDEEWTELERRLV